MPVSAAHRSTPPATAVERGPGRAPFDACPSCDGSAFHTEITVDRPIFRCTACGAGWMYELGYVRAVAGTG
jgi:hypothetical protein